MPRPTAVPRLGAVLALAVALLLAATPARALDDLFVRNLAQGQFRDLSAELGLGLAAYQLRPAASLGFPGFDIGAEVTAVDISEDRAYWRLAFQNPNDAPSFLPVPKLHASVGLPLGIDLGALYSKVPSSNISMWGAEAKWSVVRGGLVWPALAVRGAYTSLEGVDELDLSTRSIDASVSKGFGPVTPYVGVGRVWIEAEPRDVAAAPIPFGAGLTDEKATEDRVFAGVRLRLLLLSFAAEADWSRVPAYSFRVNVSF